MSVSQKAVVCILTSLIFCGGAGAIGTDSTANPYQSIVDRNVFGLKPPPPAKPAEPEKPPPPKITLNGVTTIFGNKRAVMSVQMPAKPPEPAKQQSFILAEGQRDGDLEVLEIDPTLEGGTVKVNNFGQVQTLTMAKDGAKLPAGSPVPAPGVPPFPGGYVPPPGFNPVVNPVANPAVNAVPNPAVGGLKTIPTRQLRLPTPGASAATPGGSSPTPAVPGFKPRPGQQ